MRTLAVFKRNGSQIPYANCDVRDEKRVKKDRRYLDVDVFETLTFSDAPQNVHGDSYRNIE
jgi:hypothetical protein